MELYDNCLLIPIDHVDHYVNQGFDFAIKVLPQNVRCPKSTTAYGRKLAELIRDRKIIIIIIMIVEQNGVISYRQIFPQITHHLFIIFPLPADFTSKTGVPLKTLPYAVIHNPIAKGNKKIEANDISNKL